MPHHPWCAIELRPHMRGLTAPVACDCRDVPADAAAACTDLWRQLVALEPEEIDHAAVDVRVCEGEEFDVVGPIGTTTATGGTPIHGLDAVEALAFMRAGLVEPMEAA